MDQNKQTYIDNVLFGLAKEHGGVPDLLNSFFGFLARKTDFFVGGGEGAALNLVMDAFNRWKQQADSVEAKKRKERDEAEKRHKERLERKKREEEELIRKAKQENESGICEVTEEEAQQFEAEQKAKKGKHHF